MRSRLFKLDDVKRYEQKNFYIGFYNCFIKPKCQQISFDGGETLVDTIVIIPEEFLYQLQKFRDYQPISKQHIRFENTRSSFNLFIKIYDCPNVRTGP